MNSSISNIFTAIKNGTLLEELYKFDNDSLKLFLPSLMLASFPTALDFSNELDVLRSRLVEMPAGNQFIRFMRMDFTQVDLKCSEIWKSPNTFQSSASFVQLGSMEKVLTLCAHLISRMQREHLPSDNKAEFFEAFDIEHCHEEVVWILSLASFFMPKLFNLVKFSRYLLSYQSGPRLIYLLLLNQPDMFDAQIEELLSLKCPDENGFLAKQRRDSLLKLFALEPEQAERYLTAMLSGESHLPLAVKILCSDVFSAEFFVDTLISHFIKNDDSLTIFITKTSRTCLRKVCERVGKIICVLEPLNDDLNERMILLIALLCSYSTIRLSNDECHQWVHFLTHQKSAHANPLKMTLAVILACPNLTPNQQAFRDELVENYLIDYFEGIRELASTSSNSDYESLSQMMLLVAIHMNSNKGDELASLVSSVLGFKVNETLKKLTTVRTLYLRHAVTERDIAEKAAKLGVTKGLNANSSGYLPVHCINHLLSSRTFSKHQIPIQQWIKSQMLECTAPVHPIMTNLLKNFSSSCVPTVEHETFNRAIEEQFFWDIFSTDLFECVANVGASSQQSVAVVQLLALFYLISYTFKLDTASLPLSKSTATRAPSAYSQRLWAKIPIRYLLIILDVRHEDFSTFRPVLLRFIAASMPHMLPNINSTLHNIDQQIALFGDYDCGGDTSGVSVEQFRDALRIFANSTHDSTSSKSSASSFLRLLNRVDLAPIQEQYRHWTTIVDAMESSLAPDTPRQLADKIGRIWYRLENLIPRRLYETTLQKWLSTPHAAISGRSGYVQVDNELLLAETPLIMFRVDERVFKSPPHLRCLMHMLTFYLDASRNANNLRLVKVTTMPQMKGELDEKAQLLKSLTGTQYLAVVQLLLELCDDLNEPSSELPEIRKICCAQIHQMFIADSLLPKLVHFNTYPLRLIPVMVKGVPSVHVLIGFLGDLLVGPNVERRIFGICLMSELIEQYKIPIAFSGVGLISDVLDTLLACSIDEEHIVLFLHVVDALGRMIKVSAFHAAALIETLERVRHITHARLAIYPSVVAARASPEKRLVDALERVLADCKGACLSSTNVVAATNASLRESTASAVGSA